MFKSLKLIVFCGLFILLATAAYSAPGVADTDHDMTTVTATGTIPAGQQKLCQGCHVPHKAGTQGQLWYETPGSSGIAPLCQSCHDGTVSSSPGGADVFNNSRMHINPTDGSDCSGGASSCHDVHDQTNTYFLTTAVSADLPCEGCHDGDPQPDQFVQTSNHWQEAGNLATNFNCYDCHSNGVHAGSATQTIAADTTKLLLSDNSYSATERGKFCVDCHAGTYTAGDPDVSDTYSNYRIQGTGSFETRHPTYGGGDNLTGCLECHDVHQSTPARTGGYILTSTNANSALCTNVCHTASGTSAPEIGANSHPVGADADLTGFTSTSALRWADGLDDDGTAGADWTGANTHMVCETCHSIHGRRNNGSDVYSTDNPGAPLLTVTNTAQNEICTTCHTNN